MKMAFLKSCLSYVFQFKGIKQALRDHFEGEERYMQLIANADGMWLKQGTSELHFLIDLCIYSSVHPLDYFLVFVKVFTDSEHTRLFLLGLLFPLTAQENLKMKSFCIICRTYTQIPIMLPEAPQSLWWVFFISNYFITL